MRHWTRALAISGLLTAAGFCLAAETAADLTGVKCQLWTVRDENEAGRSCTCYEGTIKALTRADTTIIAKRSRIRTFKTFFGLGADVTGEWEVLDDQEVTIPMKKIDYIRFLK